MRKILLFGIACLLAACSENGYSPIQFEKFEEQVGVTSPDGAMAEMTLTIDIPVGEDEVQNRLSEGIRTIIRESSVVEELKQPIEGSLKEICKKLIAYFPNGISKGEIEIYVATSFNLMVECEHQTEQAVVFRVTDGVYGNGGPMVSYKVIRLSDGKLMDDKEVYNITGDDIVTLVKKYGTDEQKEFDEAFIGPDGYLCPIGDSCRVLYLEGAHFWNEVTVPVDEIKGFLTEEGRTLLGVKGGLATKHEITKKDDGQEVKEDVAKPDEFGRGELGLFNLRGPVKSFKWTYVHGQSDTFTFNEDGFWIGKNGESIKKLYYGGIERDKKGRIVVGHFDYYEEYFTYNEQGILKNESTDGVSTEKIYNSDGFEVKEVVVYPPEMGADDDAEGETEIFDYTILEVDKYGNWTKRKCRQGIDTRTIEYY